MVDLGSDPKLVNKSLNVKKGDDNKKNLYAAIAIVFIFLALNLTQTYASKTKTKIVINVMIKNMIFYQIH